MDTTAAPALAMTQMYPYHSVAAPRAGIEQAWAENHAMLAEGGWKKAGPGRFERGDLRVHVVRMKEHPEDLRTARRLPADYPCRLATTRVRAEQPTAGCPPSIACRAPIRLVTGVGQDGPMAQRILPPSESWRRIDAWLATHAASDFAVLNPPATPNDIQQAERLLGTPLPSDLAESLHCHNGVRAWSTFLPEQSPLTVSGIVDHWQTRMDVAAENDGLTRRPWDDEPWWHPLWVPWAESADGGAQVIDQRPGPDAGRIGWAGHSGGGDFTDAWPDLASLLHAVAHALHEGGDVRGLHPYLTTQGELWWDEDGCEELNGQPLRAAPIGLP